MQRDPAGHDLVVNATPLGMKAGGPGAAGPAVDARYRVGKW